MEKKKVAIILHGLGANGIDTLFANLSKQWDYDNFEFTYFLAVDEDAKQFWEQTVKENGVRVIHLHDLDKKRILGWPKSLLNALKKYGPFDAIHVNMDMLNGVNLLVARMAKIKVRVCHAHTSSNKNGSFLKNFYLKVMKKLISVNATEKVACSDVCGDYFYGSNSYKTLYNGIDLTLYKERVDMCDNNSPVFITVGRMTPPKNPLFIVDLIKEICERKPNSKMLWVGGGELENQIKEKVDKLGIQDKISFLGIRNDVSSILQTCDYFLLPSLYEGLSLALAEAQAAGLDCFVSDTVSRLSDCGKCKFISLDKSAAEWADEIITYINSGEHMKTIEAQMNKFDIRCMARSLEDMYSGKNV